uniref:ABC transporter ATP-binding protein n=1 Tax=Caldicellulosiruptor sp. F32 TaxID=1214564 RepID=UPI000584491A
MIEIEGVSKSFDEIQALKDINCTVSRGSIFGIAGTNGAGKTTLLKTIAGVYKPDSGKISIYGADVHENISIKSRMFFVPDNPYFPRGFSIIDMARFFKGIYPKWSQERFEKLKSYFSLPYKKRINSFSKGKQKQVAILLGLCTIPEILILDEPFDGLDPVVRQMFKKVLIDEVAERQTTVLISSHNLRELEDLCDTIAILHEGKIVAKEDIDDLKQTVTKFQVVFKKNFDIDSLKDFKILSYIKKGNVEI